MANILSRDWRTGTYFECVPDDITHEVFRYVLPQDFSWCALPSRRCYRCWKICRCRINDYDCVVCTQCRGLFVRHADCHPDNFEFNASNCSTCSLVNNLTAMEALGFNISNYTVTHLK